MALNMPLDVTVRCSVIIPTLNRAHFLPRSVESVRGSDVSDAEVIVVDPASQQSEVIAYGREPSWSRDGEWLAYTALNGVYIVRKDGTEVRKLVDIDSRSESYPNTSQGIGWYGGLPAPSWSPDGKWIVYHRMISDGPAIYKVNVESGEEIGIFKGGIYPNWRWDVATEE